MIQYWLVVLVGLVGLTSAQRLVLEPLSAEQYPLARCNSNEQATYYRTEATAEEALEYPGYVIYLEGGGLCVDEEECNWRCGVPVAQSLCRARTQPTMREWDGILSSDPAGNPPFHDYYKVYVPYCSSDQYCGDRDGDPDNANDYPFRGYRIVEAVVNSLKEVANLDRADATVVLTGVSAGGGGVGFTCPNFRSLIDNAKSFCVADAAGLFPDVPCAWEGCEPYQEYLMRGNTYWNGILPPDFNILTYWREYPEPAMIGIHMYDDWCYWYWGYDENNAEHQQIWEDGMTAVIEDFREARPDASLFVPSCYGHGMIDHDWWFNDVLVGENGRSYAEAIMDWQDEDRDPNDDGHMATDAGDRGSCTGWRCNPACGVDHQ